MKKTIISLAVLFFAQLTYGQDGAINLLFTARNYTSYVQLDSIRVTNRTIGGDTVLYWNDTVLTICYVSLPKMPGAKDNFRVFGNLPDPVTGETIISIRVPERDEVEMTVTDLQGRSISHAVRFLEAGVHDFRMIPGLGDLWIFMARWRGERSCVKVLQTILAANRSNAMEYLGAGVVQPRFKSSESTGNFAFNPGDELLFTGYANGLQSGKHDRPSASKLYVFQFATNVSCPGMPTIYYQGVEYNTLQIYSQCWLKENLNAGTMISPGQNQTNNGIMEKYCPEDSEDSCTKYGGLYQWDELMQYELQPGVQGICPGGWHIPDDEDWKLLEGAVDSQFGIGDPEWDGISYRGYDAGMNLKSSDGWYANGNGPDPYGFAGLPGGYSYIWGYFYKINREAYWWSSTEINNYAWCRLISYNRNDIHRLNFDKIYGFNVRCLKN